MNTKSEKKKIMPDTATMHGKRIKHDNNMAHI